jgi:hypothetical protein
LGFCEFIKGVFAEFLHQRKLRLLGHGEDCSALGGGKSHGGDNPAPVFLDVGPRLRKRGGENAPQLA